MNKGKGSEPIDSFFHFLKYKDFFSIIGECEGGFIALLKKNIVGDLGLDTEVVCDLMIEEPENPVLISVYFRGKDLNVFAGFFKVEPKTNIAYIDAPNEAKTFTTKETRTLSVLGGIRNIRSVEDYDFSKTF